MLLTSLDGMLYPLELRWLQGHGFRGYTPWHLVTEERARGLREEFRRETATDFHETRDLLPFAARQDMDDIAGFVVDGGQVTPRVVTVHLTWRGAGELRGFPSMRHHDSLWSWLRECIAETAQWCSEEELADLLEDAP